MKKKLFPLILALLMLLSLFGCGKDAEVPAPSDLAKPVESAEPSPSESAEPDGSSFTVTDMTGRTVTFDEIPQRVVALMPADCEILFALGAGDSLVGRGEYCDYPQEVLDIPAVQSGSELNLEQVIALEPDVIFMTTMAQSEEQVAALEKSGIPVVISASSDESLESVYTAIELVGTVMGRTHEAATLTGEMQAAFEEIASKATGDGSKTVYFEVSPLEYGLWTAGSGTFMDELCTMLGLSNAFSDVSGWAEVSEEQVIQRDPDYIVTITMYFGEGPRPEEEIAGRPGWQEMKAIQNMAILNADSNEISRPGPRLKDAAETLYNFFYGV